MENIIAYHCAPALAGIKPSNIVTCYKNKIKNIKEQIEKLNKELNAKDIYLEVLCECENRVLLMVYRKKKLKSVIENEGVREFLVSCGYPKAGDLNSYIEHLKHNLETEGISHEIGAFLGYPLHDIYGFMAHKDCLFCGEWKVYENAEEARKTFTRFDKCRKAVCKHIAGGKTLAQVFC